MKLPEAKAYTPAQPRLVSLYMDSDANVHDAEEGAIYEQVESDFDEALCELPNDPSGGELVRWLIENENLVKERIRVAYVLGCV